MLRMEYYLVGFILMLVSTVILAQAVQNPLKPCISNPMEEARIHGEKLKLVPFTVRTFDDMGCELFVFSEDSGKFYVDCATMFKQLEELENSP